MTQTLWLSQGKVLRDSLGQVILCGHCPCEPECALILSGTLDSDSAIPGAGYNWTAASGPGTLVWFFTASGAGASDQLEETTATIDLFPVTGMTDGLTISFYWSATSDGTHGLPGAVTAIAFALVVDGSPVGSTQTFYPPTSSDGAQGEIVGGQNNTWGLAVGTSLGTTFGVRVTVTVNQPCTVYMGGPDVFHGFRYSFYDCFG